MQKWLECREKPSDGSDAWVLQVSLEPIYINGLAALAEGRGLMIDGTVLLCSAHGLQLVVEVQCAVPVVDGMRCG